MLLNKKLKLLIILLSILLGLVDVYAGEPRKINSLKDVLIKNKEGGVLVRFEFQQPLQNQEAPVFYKKSARMDFVNSKFKSSAQYFPIKNSIVDQIYISQFEPEKLRMRFMLANNDGSFDKKFKWEVKGRFLNISILNDHKSLFDDLGLVETLKTKSVDERIEKKVISSKPKAKINSDGEALLKGLSKPSSDSPQLFKNKSPNVLFKSKEQSGPNNKPPVKSKIQKPEESVKRHTKPIFADTLNLRSTSLKMVYMMLVVLGILFSIFYLFKKFVLKNSIFAGADKPVNVLSTGYLGPKKSIALVEVAGEVLVLGIANDNISLLSNIKDANKVERIKHPESPTKLSSIVIKKKTDNGTENHSSEVKKTSYFDNSGESSELDNKYTKSDVAMMIRKNLEKMGAAK